MLNLPATAIGMMVLTIGSFTAGLRAAEFTHEVSPEFVSSLARSGDKHGLYMEGRLSASSSPGRALELFADSARKAYPPAFLAAGEASIQGFGGRPDLLQADAYLHSAYRLGITTAKIPLFKLWSLYPTALRRTHAEAVALLHAEASAGDVDALFLLYLANCDGRYLLRDPNGISTIPITFGGNPRSAAIWLQRLATLGVTEAECLLGASQLATGQRPEAERYLKRAAGKNHPIARNLLIQIEFEQAQVRAQREYLARTKEIRRKFMELDGKSRSEMEKSLSNLAPSQEADPLGIAIGAVENMQRMLFDELFKFEPLVPEVYPAGTEVQNRSSFVRWTGKIVGVTRNGDQCRIKVEETSPHFGGFGPRAGDTIIVADYDCKAKVANVFNYPARLEVAQTNIDGGMPAGERASNLQSELDKLAARAGLLAGRQGTLAERMRGQATVAFLNGNIWRGLVENVDAEKITLVTETGYRMAVNSSALKEVENDQDLIFYEPNERKLCSGAEIESRRARDVRVVNKTGQTVELVMEAFRNHKGKMVLLSSGQQRDSTPNLLAAIFGGNGRLVRSPDERLKWSIGPDHDALLTTKEKRLMSSRLCFLIRNADGENRHVWWKEEEGAELLVEITKEHLPQEKFVRFGQWLIFQPSDQNGRRSIQIEASCEVENTGSFDLSVKLDVLFEFARWSAIPSKLVPVKFDIRRGAKQLVSVITSADGLLHPWYGGMQATLATQVNVVENRRP